MSRGSQMVTTAPPARRPESGRWSRGAYRPDERRAAPAVPAAVEVELTGDVVVDMARVGLVHPVGLGLLVRAHREAKQRGAVLCLAAPSRFVVTVLHTMCLTSVFPVLEDREQALAWLARQRRAADAAPTPEEAQVA